MSNNQAQVSKIQQAEGKRIPEYETAIERGAASFTQLSRVHFGQREEFNEDKVDRVAHARYYSQIQEAFVAEHGGIVKLLWCQNTRGGAVLTANNELHVVCRGASDALLEFMFECDRLVDECRLTLTGRDLSRCVEMAYDVVAFALCDFDARATNGGPRGDEVDSHRMAVYLSQLSRAQDYFRRAAQRNAQISYFIGMLIGITCLALVGALLGFVLPGTSVFRAALLLLLASLFSGGIGAMVSVMSRMTFGTLELKYEAGRRYLMLLGGFRPIVGSVFGGAVFMLVVSGLLPLAEPSDPSKQLYFYSAIAFLAGFSERWAQDMLVVTQRRIAGGAREEEAESADSERDAPID